MAVDNDTKSGQAERPDAARDAARRLRSFAEGGPIVDEAPELIRLADLAVSRISDPAERARLAEDLIAALTVLRFGPLLGGNPDAARLQTLAILEFVEADIP